MDIALDTFKSLLQVLREKEISLKVRTHSGWSKDYLQIIGFIASMNDQKNNTFAGIVLSNVSETEGILINNIQTITAFELKLACPPFEEKLIYTVGHNVPSDALVVD